MNMVSCGEDCRYQIDGFCTRVGLTVNGAPDPASESLKCCYFERR